jgi:hypothetical protein
MSAKIAAVIYLAASAWCAARRLSREEPHVQITVRTVDCVIQTTAQKAEPGHGTAIRTLSVLRSRMRAASGTPIECTISYFHPYPNGPKAFLATELVPPT